MPQQMIIIAVPFSIQVAQSASRVEIRGELGRILFHKKAVLSVKLEFLNNSKNRKITQLTQFQNQKWPR